MLHLNKAVPERRESEVNYDFLQIYNEDRRRDDGGGCRFLLLADGFSQEAVEVMGGASVPMAYEEALFDTNQVMRIDIQIEREKWEAMLENATAKEYYACDVQINDQKYAMSVSARKAIQASPRLQGIQRQTDTV